MEYKMGSCIGISQRQVIRRKGSPRWAECCCSASTRRHSRAARECGRREVHSSVRRSGGSASGKWCANRCRMGGVLLRADGADVTSSGVRVLRSLGDTAAAEWREVGVGSGGCRAVATTDQTSFIYRAENKPAVPTGFAVGWKWTLIAADFKKRNQSSFTLGKY